MSSNVITTSRPSPIVTHTSSHYKRDDDLRWLNDVVCDDVERGLTMFYDLRNNVIYMTMYTCVLLCLPTQTSSYRTEQRLGFLGILACCMPA
eukprot:scaffold167483_cov18-Prasinocladus_malaysianus.AAC.2